MTTFQKKILEVLQAQNSEGFQNRVIEFLDSIGTPTSLLQASLVIRYFAGTQSFIIPDSIAISLTITRGSARLSINNGIVPMPSGFNLELPFRAFNYFYTGLQFELLSADTEAYLIYESAPTRKQPIRSLG